MTQETKSAVFDIGGASFELRPIKMKNLRKLIGIVNKAINEISVMDNSNPVENISNIAMSEYVEILHVLFPIEAYPLITDSFIDENIDIPTARSIIEKAIEVNRLSDLYPFLKKMTQKGGVQSTTTVGA